MSKIGKMHDEKQFKIESISNSQNGKSKNFWQTFIQFCKQFLNFFEKKNIQFVFLSFHIDFTMKRTG